MTGTLVSSCFVVAPVAAYADTDPCAVVCNVVSGGTIPEVSCAEAMSIPSPGLPTVDTTRVGDADPSDPATTAPPLGLLGSVTGIELTLTQCSGVDGGISSDGTIAVGGNVVVQPLMTTIEAPLGTMGDCGGGWHPGDGSYPGPGGAATNPNGSVNLVWPRITQATYGGVYDSCDGSNIYMTAYLFKARGKDHSGSSFSVIQSGTATAGDQTNIDRFQSFIHIDHGGEQSTLQDYDPKGDTEIGSSTPENVTLGFSYAGASVTATRTFNVSNTVFGGDTPNREGTYAPMARGGYRSIARGHRNESRYFVQMAAWNVPSGINPSWLLNIDQHAYAR